MPRSARRILKPQEECASREKSNLKKCCKNAKNVLTKRKTLDIIHKLSDSTTEYGGIAQLGERLNGIQEVSGSIPLISTIEALKTIGFQGFFLFSETFLIIRGSVLTHI